jgi:hypothetical protein
MSLDLASRVPPTIIYTTEWDFNRKNAEEACYLYEEAGTLLDCGIQASATHFVFLKWEFETSDVWFQAVADMVDTYLN